ncbi:gamma carbonic anhydrase family protein [Amycolatopsis endophytica]|uniref:Carbonic anhydrase/acetyltransferase-like protein (Isoleucine patch superfamily) n=1 Tax=Amycolatopsis endophytica TaxID=860233 RepID=A0A853BAC7_9PSEU|nr:gamma carbonic anhydrase family protein [Amycolatopsis endophytica]NYI91641.1 carbonic anhydrase/acetyltransferase-like protein (isoleucine patch superfamily) [Amycolatopsis endophytica]
MTASVVTIRGRTPRVCPTAWIAPSATVVGDVAVGPGTGVFYGAVLRADWETITVGAGSNIQDCAVVHADPGFPARVGNRVSVGHGAVLHGCRIEDGCLIGMNATVLNGAVVGAQSLVAANVLVPQGAVIPPRSLVVGVPGRVRRQLTEAEIEDCATTAARYQELLASYLAL